MTTEKEKFLEEYAEEIQYRHGCMSLGYLRMAYMLEDGRVLCNILNLEKMLFDNINDFTAWWFDDNMSVEFNYSWKIGDRDENGVIQYDDGVDLSYPHEIDNNEYEKEVWTVPVRITEKER